MEIEGYKKIKGYGAPQGVLDVSYDSVKQFDRFPDEIKPLRDDIEPMNLYDYVEILNDNLDTLDNMVRKLIRKMTEIGIHQQKSKIGITVTREEAFNTILKTYRANFPLRRLGLFVYAINVTFSESTPLPLSLCLQTQRIMKRASRIMNEASKYDLTLTPEDRQKFSAIISFDCSASIRKVRERLKMGREVPVYKWAIGKIKKELSDSEEDDGDTIEVIN
jgi:hypothetical protein